MIVNCKTCGANFDSELVRCPYCGTAYEPAAEEEFMDKLEDVRTDLEDHKDDAKKSTGRAITRTVLIFVAVIVVLLLLFVGLFLLPEMNDRRKQNEKEEEFLKKYTGKISVEYVDESLNGGIENAL